MSKLFKSIGMALVAIITTITTTGCDAKWVGGTDPVPPQPLIIPLPQTPPQVTPPSKTIVLPPGSVAGITSGGKTQQGTTTEKVWHPFRLPSRYYPGVWKEVNIKVDVPSGASRDEFNHCIAMHYQKLQELRKCFEDYPSIPRPGQRR